MMVGENRVTPVAVKEIAVDDMKKFPIRVRLQPCNSSDKHSGAYYVYLVYAYCTVESHVTDSVWQWCVQSTL